jgi:hypothetical protein
MICCRRFYMSVTFSALFQWLRTSRSVVGSSLERKQRPSVDRR